MPLSAQGDLLETNMLLPIEACEALCAGIQAEPCTLIPEP